MLHLKIRKIGMEFNFQIYFQILESIKSIHIKNNTDIGMTCPVVCYSKTSILWGKLMSFKRWHVSKNSDSKRREPFRRKCTDGGRYWIR